MVEILCSEQEDTESPLEPDLRLLSFLGVFQEKEHTGLDIILESIQEDLAEIYEFFWTINPKTDQEGGLKTVTKPTDNQKTSEELKDIENNEEDEGSDEDDDSDDDDDTNEEDNNDKGKIKPGNLKEALLATYTKMKEVAPPPDFNLSLIHISEPTRPY